MDPEVTDALTALLSLRGPCSRSSWRSADGSPSNVMGFLAIDRPTGEPCRFLLSFERRSPKTCPVLRAGGRKTCPAPGQATPKDLWVDAVVRALIGPFPRPLLAWLGRTPLVSRWSEGAFSSGGGRESNPPASFRPPTDFEDRGAHQVP